MAPIQTKTDRILYTSWPKIGCEAILTLTMHPTVFMIASTNINLKKPIHAETTCSKPQEPTEVAQSKHP